MEFPDPYNGKISIIILGHSGDGKTHMLVNTLLMKVYRGVFDEVHIFCPTIDSPRNKKIYRKIKLNRDRVYKVFDEYKIIELYEQAEKRSDDAKILFIFDDCISEAGFKKTGQDSALNKLSSVGAHRGVSTIYLTQVFTGLSASIRDHATTFITFKCINKVVSDYIYKTYSCPGSPTQFEEILARLTEKKFDHFDIDVTKNKHYHNFRELIISRKRTNGVNFIKNLEEDENNPDNTYNDDQD